MSDLHIEGMGVLGSMLARRLDEEGILFTWSDNDDPYIAWQASTGLAAPGVAGTDLWHQRLSVTPEARAVPYVFAHKAPPHGGKYKIEVDYGSLRMAEPRAVAVNVAAFVLNTRDQFKSRRLKRPEPGCEVVVAHATERNDGYLWGWVARVRFDLPGPLAADLLGERPALYAKAHRFNMTYAYPVPGEDEYWAGSVLQFQKTPRVHTEHGLRELFDDWCVQAEWLLGISNIQLIRLDQGWRPRAGKGDSGLAVRVNGQWVLPPLGPNGVRLGWLVVDDLIGARWLRDVL